MKELQAGISSENRVQKALAASPFLRGMSRGPSKMLKAKHSLLSKTGFIGKKEVEETFTAKGREKFVD